MLSFTDVLATTESDSGTRNGPSNPTDAQLIIPQSNTSLISGLQSAITIYMDISPSVQDQEFRMTITVKFSAIYGACNCTEPQIGDTITVTSSGQERFSTNVKVQERSRTASVA